jgi:hypothetical protein
MTEFFFRQTENFQPTPHGVYSVDAGEDEPVVRGQVPERRIEWLERTRRTNINERDFEDVGPEFAQLVRERARLLTGTANENADAGE